MDLNFYFPRFGFDVFNIFIIATCNLFLAKFINIFLVYIFSQ